MSTLMPDSRQVARATLDTGTRSEMTAAPVTMRNHRPRRQLVCEWRRTAEGRLACTWHQVSPHQAGLSDSQFLAEPFPALASGITRDLLAA